MAYVQVGLSHSERSRDWYVDYCTQHWQSTGGTGTGTRYFKVPVTSTVYEYSVYSTRTGQILAVAFGARPDVHDEKSIEWISA